MAFIDGDALFNTFARAVGEAEMNYLYAMKKEIGAGSFGTVMQGIDRKTGQVVAIKKIMKNGVERVEDINNISREVAVLSAFEHRHILRSHAALHDEKNVYIVTELCRDGTLEDFIVGAGTDGMNELDVLLIMLQVFEALAYAHSFGVSHRDLKLENVMLVGGEVRLIDFGLAYVRAQGPEGDGLCKSYVGTLAYAAPEVISNTPYNPEAADMWSAGVMMYALLSEDIDFQGDSNDGTPGATANFSAKRISYVTKKTLEVWAALLKIEPDERITAEEAVALTTEAIAAFRKK